MQRSLTLSPAAVSANACSVDVQDNLREVPVYEGAHVLQKELDELQPPQWVATKLQSALHAIPTAALHIPPASPGTAANAQGTASTAASVQAGSHPSGRGFTVMDPWCFDGAFSDAGGSGKVPEWLRGAVWRRPQL